MNALLRSVCLGSLYVALVSGYAELTSPVPRTHNKWQNGNSVQRTYLYSSYTPPSNGIQGCSPGSTNPMCSTLETCDSSTQGVRTGIAMGGFLTVEWDCADTPSHSQADSQSTTSGVSIAVKCGAGSGSSFFNNILTTNFDAQCHNVTQGTTKSNTVQLPDSLSGTCQILWLWELQQGGQAQGFYMGCSDLAINAQITSNSGSKEAVTQDDYDIVGAVAAIVVPMFVALVVGLFLHIKKDTLPSWVPYLRYGGITALGIAGFAMGINSNNFMVGDKSPLATEEVRFGTWVLFITLMLGFFLCYQEYREVMLQFVLVRFFFCAIMLVLLFVTGSLNALMWEGKDEYCTYSDSDDMACGVYKTFIVLQWLVFTLVLVEIVVESMEVFSGKAAQKARGAEMRGNAAAPPPRGRRAEAPGRQWGRVADGSPGPEGRAV
mmetsp:Transcript_21642/g.38416  ORF Transcript_21642/g.38416 Transcript_21642/m.38416 type:complete len:434 (-) Transcript_21642:204-1505(-)|eukprot:CAMPEP_0197526340 /NCGR_PEP_ID=MMETSP1318-20131121/17426_1 /TAXON_ID=552666 /ORGANISM="Partenskyella glossopodia, Strain RCC365" /LENGTH=433 /DNA_ID=CAMNT_0043080457 /DNA_START=53 /DNA_END=1354 /DNA_ORIENTATION=+